MQVVAATLLQARAAALGMQAGRGGWGRRVPQCILLHDMCVQHVQMKLQRTTSLPPAAMHPVNQGLDPPASSSSLPIDTIHSRPTNTANCNSQRQEQPPMRTCLQLQLAH